jgi:hypothetical protein
VLPSWTNLSLSQPRKIAGIYIGKRHLSAVLLAYKQGVWEEQAARVVALAEPLFDSLPTPAIEADLVKSLKAVAADFSTGFVPLRIALPDAVLRSSTLELDAMPKTEKLQQDLLRWRFSKDMQRPEEAIICAGQALGADNVKQLLFGQVLDRHWLACLNRAFAQAEIMPWTLNALAGYRHNCYYHAFEQTGGALITIDPDSWGLQLWDGAKRLRYVRSRWRETDLDYDLMFEEIERSIRSHSHSASGYQIERLYLAGKDDEIDQLNQVLNSKLKQGVARLDIAALAAAPTNKQYEGELLLARTAATGYED